MTDKVVLSPVSSFVNDTTAVSTVNNNMVAITTAMDNTLSRDGTSPNMMNATLDMNSNQIMNLPAPGSMNSPARLIDVASNPTIVVPAIATNGPALNDTTTVIASLAKFYNPSFFGTPSTGVVHRLNRLQIGEATLSSQDVVASNGLGFLGPTTPDWFDTLYRGQAIGSGQLSVVAAWGNSPISAASRTSDYRTVLGGASGGSGCNLFGVNDDTTAGNPVAYGVNSIGIRKSGVGGATFGAQFDINNLGSVVSISPNSTIGGGGQTFSALFTPGAYSQIGSLFNVSAALIIGIGVTRAFEKGIVFQAGSLNASNGPFGVGGLGMELPRGVGIQWTSSVPNTDGIIWADVNGFNVSSSRLIANANTAYTVTSPPSGTVLHLISADNSQCNITVDSFGNGLGNVLVFRNAAGTNVSKTATTSTTQVLNLVAQGYDGSVYATGANLSVSAINLWSGTDHGMYWAFNTVPAASVTKTEAMRIQGSGGVSIGTTTDPGIGSLILNGSLLHPTIANGAVATAMSSVGPTGSHATIQEWFPIKNASGVVRYVAGF